MMQAFGLIGSYQSFDTCIILCYPCYMDKHRFTLIMPVAIWKRLKALAERNRRPITQEIIIAIEERLEREKA